MNASTNTNKNETVTGTCGKCSGAGYINAFGHYANGVCFDCGGTGVIEVSATHVQHATPAPSKYTPEQVARQRAWLQTCTEAQLERCSWNQIREAHELACAMKFDGEISDRQFRRVKNAIVGWVID